MAVIFNISSPLGQRISVWEITEDEATLAGNLNLTEKAQLILSTFTNKTRRLQWLAVRNLLKKFHPAGVIEYKSNGKPYLVDHEEYISVSHAGKYAAISLCKTGVTGVDIEEMDVRILKIGERFTNDEEKAFMTEENRVEQLCIIWGAKEVLFKMLEMEGVSFKENFLVKPFALVEKGTLETIVNRGDRKETIAMEYVKINNHILVYSKNSEL